MASAASPASSGGVAASMWASVKEPTRNARWQGSKEPGLGPAFHGVGRGRIRGRGGRGGNKGGGPNREDKDKAAKTNAQPQEASNQEASNNVSPSVSTLLAAPAISREASNTAPSKLSNASRPKESKPPTRKVSEAKPSRKLPPILVDPPPASSLDSPVSAVSATTPSRTRRKRPTQTQNRKKSPSSAFSPTHLGPEISPVTVKDLPPHLAPPPPETPSFDIKHDIDALVERVRAVAMDRPNTPRSHIDWAGEDDDSLPDLDDWGVTSVTDKRTSIVGPDQPDLISPILAGALKPLPNIEFSFPLVAPLAGSQQGSPAMLAVTPPTAPPKVEVEENTPRGAPVHQAIGSVTTTAENNNNAADEDPGLKKGPAKERSDAAARLPALNGFTSAAYKDVSIRQSPLKQTNVSLHPSLPAKPIEAIDALKPVPSKSVPVQGPGSAVTVEPKRESGLSESTHAPKSNDSAEQHERASSESSSSPDPEGVASSIHAPKSAPTQITTHPSVSTPSFHPTHGRAHTMGRPNGFRGPLSPSKGSFPEGPSDERTSRSHKDRINHARNHSSPPVGPGTSTAHSRTAHVSRPVITVGALSRLARDLGAPPKRNAAEPSTTTTTGASPKE